MKQSFVKSIKQIIETQLLITKCYFIQFSFYSFYRTSFLFHNRYFYF